MFRTVLVLLLGATGGHQNSVYILKHVLPAWQWSVVIYCTMLFDDHSRDFVGLYRLLRLSVGEL